MDQNRDSSCTDVYYTTALQIFDYCGAKSTSTVKVDLLMDKFEPFIKANKAEYRLLKLLLDPDQENPEINVTKLANSLHDFSENKCKTDFDESFNRSGLGPLDSDSGISTDGFQLLEEVQSELREKAHLAKRLQTQLEYTDKQHEDVVATLTAERDSLKTHLNMLREENESLMNARRDYEEAIDRLFTCEKALAETNRELKKLKKNSEISTQQIAMLENEKLSLQELLSASKAECHRINEMYASRQATLREQNEGLKADLAERNARLMDHDLIVQQLIKDKVVLEMELKEVLNKCNQTQLRLDRSIDVSYTEDQMLTALDTLNADSKFVSENHLLDEESFTNAIQEDQGRLTNMSLFDEICLSFGTNAKLSLSNCQELETDNTEALEKFSKDVTTQTDEDTNNNETKCKNFTFDNSSPTEHFDNFATDNFPTILTSQDTKSAQTEHTGRLIQTQKVLTTDEMSYCRKCKELKTYAAKLESDLKRSRKAVAEIQEDLEAYEDNMNMLQRLVDDGNEKNRLLTTVVENLQVKFDILENSCQNCDNAAQCLPTTCSCVQIQTEFDVTSVSTQVEAPCVECESRRGSLPARNIRRLLWESLKSLFQFFAVICFLCAISLLYGVSNRRWMRCERDELPWRWFNLQSILDTFLRVEYIEDEPM